MILGYSKAFAVTKGFRLEVAGSTNRAYLRGLNYAYLHTEMVSVEMPMRGTCLVKMKNFSLYIQQGIIFSTAA